MKKIKQNNYKTNNNNNHNNNNRVIANIKGKHKQCTDLYLAFQSVKKQQSINYCIKMIILLFLR